MPAILTVDNQVQCPHGGQATLITTNECFTAGGSLALLESDIHVVAACPFTVGVVYSPCVMIQWTGGAESLTVGGVGVLVESSVGLCCNAAGAPQGPAVIGDSTPEVTAV